MVTICTASLTFNNSTFCPHTVFMCFVWISEQTAIISLYNINWPVFIPQTQCVYCAVRTGCLNTVQVNRNLSVINFMCRKSQTDPPALFCPLNTITPQQPSLPVCRQPPSDPPTQQHNTVQPHSHSSTNTNIHISRPVIQIPDIYTARNFT